jgi:hypothetical protein
MSVNWMIMLICYTALHFSLTVVELHKNAFSGHLVGLH